MLLAPLVAMCMVISAAMPATALPASATETGGTSQDQVTSHNIWTNEYSSEGGGNWASTVTSHIEATDDGGYDIVEWADSALHVEHYDSRFSFVSSRAITPSTYTPTGATAVRWGGYLNGSQYRFVVTGQANPTESDSVAVVRVTKYSKSWQYLGNVEYSGINTYMPFRGGSLRMAEANGELWIRTCHEIYAIQGMHHQTNMTLRIRESDLAKLASDTGVEDYASGYVSHSFNQYLVTAGGKIYGADHGDAYPRRITIKDITPSDGSTGGRTFPVMSFKGSSGDNFTGATFDGLESSSNGASLIAVGTIADQDKSFPSSGGDVKSGTRNVWVGIVPTNGGAVTVKNITTLPFDDEKTATDPVLVKLGENRFILLWSTRSKDEQSAYAKHGNVQYAFMDATGKLTSPIATIDATLSDCHPIVVNNHLVWFSSGTSQKTRWSWDYPNETPEEAQAREESENTAPVFYSLDLGKGGLTTHDSTTAYTVYFLGNEGTPKMTSVKVPVNATVKPPKTPTREHYDFDGWHWDSYYDYPYDFNRPVTSDIMLYAHWQGEKHTITFNPNGGETSETSRVVRYKQAAYPLPEATRPGYTFEGWYTQSTGGTAIGDAYTMDLSDVTFYAHWKANEYTVTFDPDGGSVTTASKKVTEGEPYGTLPTPTKAGHSFVGWQQGEWYDSQSKQHPAQIVSPDTKYTLANDSTLTALWKKLSYTVRFDSAGGSGVAAQTVEYGSHVSEPKNPQRTGYAFDGWYTAATGGSRYDFSAPITGDITLHAHWKANSYTLTFDGNGGRSTENSRSVAYGSEYGVLPTATRTGYTFQGWYTTKDGGSKVTDKTTMSFGNTTVFAHWKANSYTVTLDAAGGASAVKTLKVTQDQPYGALPVPARAGNTFMGWYATKNGGSKVTPATVFTEAKDITLYARWSVTMHTVSFNSAGGGKVASQRVADSGKTTKPKDPLRAGYVFAGWYTSSGKAFDFNTPITADTTLIAHWTKQGVISRVAGSTRYDTMTGLVASGSWSQDGTVLVASGSNYPDALAASGLAGVFGAPIVLTDPGSLSGQASNALQKLRPSKIIVVGGQSAVSGNVFRQLSAAYPKAKVERVAGADRTDTSLELYAKGGKGWGRTAVIATGSGFADALSVSPYAYATKAPVFLVGASGLSSGQRHTLHDGGFTTLLVIGGEAVIPESVVHDAAALAGVKATVTRLSGATRYETSVSVAEYALAHGLHADGLVIASGANFPDALAAGPLAGRRGSVMLLADSPSDATVEYMGSLNGVSQATIAGGKAAVGTETANVIAQKLHLRMQ